jgi:hypothetical protein
MVAHNSSRVADILEQSFSFLGDVSENQESPGDAALQGEQSWHTFDKGVID